MKKYFLIAAMMLGLASPAVIAKDKNPNKPVDPQTELRLRQIEARVMEIKNMDKSDLSGTERKAIRKELTSLKKEAKAFTSGGIYLSVAAIIIIILVLILII